MAKQADIDALLVALFGGAHAPLAPRMGVWLAESATFLAFVTANETKIRRKLRGTHDAEGLRDIEAELATAYRLLRDRRVVLGYESYLAAKLRGPDFTVTFKGHIVFNVEVRRLRTEPTAAKITDALCEKLRQMPPSLPNVVALYADVAGTSPDLDALMKSLRSAADAKHEEMFTRRGYLDARDFLRALQRLSAVFLYSTSDPIAAPPLTQWANVAAKHPLPPDARKLLV
jgi:hypothetical protein